MSAELNTSTSQRESTVSTPVITMETYLEKEKI
jgi:hypothetical protein